VHRSFRPDVVLLPLSLMNRAAATALIAVACLAVPAAAGASVASTAANRRADRAALSAYATYLQSLAGGKSAGVEAEQIFSSQTAGTCFKALGPIATSQSVPAGTSTALTDIGDEIGADAGLEFLTSASTPMNQLASTLAPLRWGTFAAATAVKRFLTAEDALIALEPSNLCGDALSVASQANAEQVIVPPATQTFLDTYAAASTVANARLTAFVKLLDSYVISSDRAVATKIDALAARVNDLSTTAIAAGTKSLFHALGVPVSGPAV
jgi:hypothetical protein